MNATARMELPIMDSEEFTSRIPGFYNLSIEERQAHLARTLGQTGVANTFDTGGLDPDRADKMIENVVGIFALPLGIALNFQINGRDYLIPMAIEEPSVVAGASYAAKLVRDGGGFHAETDPPLMIAQVQVVDVPDMDAAVNRLNERKADLLALANQQDALLIKLGGGARDLEVRRLDTRLGAMLIVHYLVDVRDAMGANAVNTMAEQTAPLIEELTSGHVYLRILSNLADHRLARAHARVPKESLAMEGYSGEAVVRGIALASAFAEADPYRAATHNKGVMNGIDAVVIATGNDWRAVEAGAHSYAAHKTGNYTALTRWDADANGDLVGSIELPLAVGLVGGATKVHPAAQAAIKLLGVQTARELAEVLAAVGLAQNLAAIRALATEGIQKGHMALHARQVAAAAGASGDEIDRLAARLVDERNIKIDRAEELLKESENG